MPVTNPKSSLHAEYLQLLHQYGLPVLKPEESVGEKLKRLQKMVADDSEGCLRVYATQTLSAIEALNEVTGGAVHAELQKEGITDGTSELSQCVSRVSEVMKAKHTKLAQELYFNIFPTGEFNACAVLTNSGVLCLLNIGLLKLLYNVAMACCYPVHSERNGGISLKEKEEPRNVPLPIISLSCIIRIVVKYIFENIRRYQMPYNQKLDPWGVVIANVLDYGMKTFVVAHEVGHVALGHMSKGNTRSVLTPHGPLESLSRSHKEEYEADLWAQDILFQSDETNRRSFPLAVGGPSFLTVHLMIIEVLRKLAPDANVAKLSADSHPSSHDRLATLKNHIEQKLGHRKDEIFSLCALLWRILYLIRSTDIEVSEHRIALNTPDGRYVIEDKETIMF